MWMKKRIMRSLRRTMIIVWAVENIRCRRRRRMICLLPKRSDLLIKVVEPCMTLIFESVKTTTKF